MSWRGGKGGWFRSVVAAIVNATPRIFVELVLFLRHWVHGNVYSCRFAVFGDVRVPILSCHLTQQPH